MNLELRLIRMFFESRFLWVWDFGGEMLFIMFDMIIKIKGKEIISLNLILLFLEMILIYNFLVFLKLRIIKNQKINIEIIYKDNKKNSYVWLINIANSID